LGDTLRDKKNLRRESFLVTAQTLWNIRKLKDQYGLKSDGEVVDMLVQEKMVKMRGKNDAIYYRGNKTSRL
jgi:hypothetical protein